MLRAVGCICLLHGCGSDAPASPQLDAQPLDSTDVSATPDTHGDCTCTDDNACTLDECLPDGTCMHRALALTCDDADACTSGDHCEAGVCRGLPIAPTTCDDGQPCTDDGCAPGSGCTHIALACACTTDSDCATLDDGNACNGKLHCDQGALPFHCAVVPGSIVSCSAAHNTACLHQACDPASGQCLAMAMTATCDDGNACTWGDACQDGACVPSGIVSCDDSNLCTIDSCHLQAGCEHAPVPDGIGCDADGSSCTVGDKCAGGICTQGATATCNDANPCTQDACDPALGCTFLPVSATCTDGSACTEGDKCADGQCVGGSPVPCDDGNACTSDACDLATGCTATALADGSGCDADSSACTFGDACLAGQCKPGKALSCSDGSACTVDSCDPALGCVSLPISGTCTDGNGCTEGDVCKDGQCVGGIPATCDDDNPCTADGCEKGLCGHAASPDGTPCTATGATCQKGLCMHSAWDMVLIPAGSVTMGCDPGQDPSCQANEGPPHVVKVPSFWINRHEITVAQYKVCTKTVTTPGSKYGFCVAPVAAYDGTAAGQVFNWNAPNRSGHPVNGIGYWSRAREYCEFQTDWPDIEGALPSEAQWEVAARGHCDAIPGGCNTPPPLDTWGKGALPPGFENLADLAYLVKYPGSPVVANYVDGSALTASIGSFQANVWGLFDMGGNVGEVVADCWHPDFSGAPTDGSAWMGCASDSPHVVRGPSYASGVELHVTQRRPRDSVPDASAGFRCVRPLLPCDDGNACTVDKPVAAGCEHVNSPNNQWCNTFDACVGEGKCQQGVCIPPPQFPCDDGDVCTMDTCDKLKGCLHISVASVCDDGNPCTTDSCATKTGCGHVAAPGPCDDGMVCTQGDACVDGLCNGKTKECDDGNACTNDKCANYLPTGCYHEIVPNNYGLPCDVSATCIGSTCVGWQDDMVTIPQGTFFKGCTPAVGKASCNNDPNLSVLVDVPAVQLDRTEVTVAAYAACVTAGGCTPAVIGTESPNSAGYRCLWKDPTGVSLPGLRPINCVTRQQSEDFCSWRGKRLPTDAEWEKAARGGCALYGSADCAAAEPVQPWGNQPASCVLAVMTDAKYALSTGCGGIGPMDTGSRPQGKSPYGLLDMVGNVAERVQDCTHAVPVAAGPTDGSAWVTGCFVANQRVVRGGSYQNTMSSPELSAWGSSGITDTAASPIVGFRCARNPLP
jgi:formylglycine-generating enzyme required for sulfatase activity